MRVVVVAFGLCLLQACELNDLSVEERAEALGVNTAPSATPAQNPAPTVTPRPTSAATATPTPLQTPFPTTTPTPEPTTSGTPGQDDSAADCYNPMLYSSGSSYSVNYITDANNSSISAEIHGNTTGEATFNNQPTIEISEEISRTGTANGTAISSQSIFKTYFQPDDAAKSVGIVGADERGTNANGRSFTEMQTYEPPYEYRYDLEPGEGFTQVNNVTFDYGSSSFATDLTTTMTFLGREIIEVPAGSIEACKFSVAQTADPNSGSPPYTYYIWVDVDSGIEVRILHDSEDRQLVSGSMNGRPVD